MLLPFKFFRVQRKKQSSPAPEYIVLDFCFKNFGCGCNLCWEKEFTILSAGTASGG